MRQGWIGVDFDGTLATYLGNHTIMGEPIMPMVNRVKHWLSKGQDVKIFTARVSLKNATKNELVRNAIQDWCMVHIGKRLDVVCVKDIHCIQLWDDKAIRVIRNTGYSEAEYKKHRQRRRV